MLSGTPNVSVRSEATHETRDTVARYDQYRYCQPCRIKNADYRTE